LEVQREKAFSLVDVLKAEELDREPELKLDLAANAIERHAQLAAEAEGYDYERLTQRGARVHAVRQAKELDQTRSSNVSRELRAGVRRGA
jgi:hypothetical protein